MIYENDTQKNEQRGAIIDDVKTLKKKRKKKIMKNSFPTLTALKLVTNSSSDYNSGTFM